MDKKYKYWWKFYGIILFYILLNVISCICVSISSSNTKFIGKYYENSSWDIIELNSTYYSIGLFLLAISFTLIYLKLIKPRLIDIFKSDKTLVKVFTGLSIPVFMFVNAVAAYFTEIICTGLFSTYDYPVAIYYFLGYIVLFIILDLIIAKRKNKKAI